MMPADAWVALESIFAAALAAEPDARAALLDARCATPEIRAQVESLLAAHARAGTFLDPPAPAHPGDAADLLTGRSLGAFRVGAPVGRGGMGVVYSGERIGGGFMQRVAIKVIDAPLQSQAALRRFKAERQILAVLGHPHIVGLIDGGVEDGHAYLVMEFVEGTPITQHVRERRLTLEERLRLMQRVCGAVHYAQQHGVIHRDLKPGNILVTADNVPKVLDFGVAKLLDPAGDDTDPTLTALGRPLTPNYASPEQLRGLAVTVAADIYALGVLLYEVLAGTRPYDTTGLPLDEILRVVLDSTPRRPSACATDTPYDARALRGDLDAIVLKAMSAEPARRYASAQELSDDLGRFLDKAPVVAREPSLRYLAGKAARRHRAAFAAGALSALALLAALSVSLWERHLAVVARDQSNARYNDARQLAESLLFKVESDVAKLDGSTAVRREIVAEALTYLERLSRDRTGDDAVSLDIARAYHRIGDVQGNQSVANLGDPRGALDSYRRGIAVLAPLVSGRSPSRDARLEMGRMKLAFANVARITTARGDALAATQEAAALAAQVLARNSGDTAARELQASAEFQLAAGSSGAESLTHWKRAGDLFAQVLAEKPDDPNRQRNLALVHKYLANHYTNDGKDDEALTHFEQARALDERRLQAAPTSRQVQFDFAIDLSGVADGYWSLGRPNDAVPLFERSLALRQALADADPNDVLSRSRLAFAHGRLTRLYTQLGRAPEAIDHARRAVALDKTLASINATNRALYAADLEALAAAEARAGHNTAACAAYAEALAAGTQASQPVLDEGSSAALNRVMERTRYALGSCDRR